LSTHQFLRDKAIEKKMMIVEKIKNAEIEMNRLGKVLFQICVKVGFKQQSESIVSKWSKSKNHQPWKSSIKH
jgi:hypothetical protein